MASVLDGLEVLDLSRGMAGAITTMLLAANGARVTRILRPGTHPFDAWPGERVWARGKRSAVLDLASPPDRDCFLASARGADVVVTTFRPGAAERLGVSH